MTHEHKRQGFRRSITRRRFILSTSMLPFAAWAAVRPQGWGLAAFGQEGVEAVLDIYSRELEAIMRQVGTPTIAAIKARAILHRGAA